MNETQPETPGSGRIWKRRRIAIAAVGIVLTTLIVIVFLGLLGPTMCGGYGGDSIMPNIVNSL